LARGLFKRVLITEVQVLNINKFLKGLVVPVLRNVQDMNYADIEKGINALGEKAKHNQVSYFRKTP